MIILTEEQKKKIRAEIEALSETVSDLSLSIAPGERGSVQLVDDKVRETHGIDIVIECPKIAEKYIEDAFSEFNVNIRKKTYNNGYILGLTLTEYKNLLKGSIVLAIEYQKELATKSPEGLHVEMQIKKEFNDILKQIDKQSSGAQA
jgi:hypothetical protein